MLEWKERANCKGIDTKLFFPGKGEEEKTAKEVCQGCVVREECLEYALRNRECFGIWGGMSERQRKKLRVRRNRERLVG